MAKNSKTPKTSLADNYGYKEKETLLRPDAGLQAQFKKKKPAKTYKYDSSIDPQMSWDTNLAREQAESLIADILKADSLDKAKFAAEKLKSMSAPFLNWAGKAENGEFSVPTLPLFVHERLSTKAVLESVKKRQLQMNMFGDSDLDITDRSLGAYEYKTGWVNRLIMGDNLQVMNSLLEYEGLGGQVQMIYMDPPYGVKFGSNFQSFIRKRDVKNNDDNDFTREPEMVQAYRDTWELGLHSYLTYLRDRFKLARELLHTSGSIFVQIGDENVHHVREIMGEIFGEENFISLIQFKKTAYQETNFLPNVCDFLVWYAKDIQRTKINRLFKPRDIDMIQSGFTWLEQKNGLVTKAPANITDDPPDSKRFQSSNLTSQGYSEVGSKPFEFDGRIFDIGGNRHWKTNKEGLMKLAASKRLFAVGNTLTFKRYESDFPLAPFNNMWDDTVRSTFAASKFYIVQTNDKVIERCILMTTDPGDLVLDPTCGSGTTAYCAEKWGRRWITTDVSRVPLALTRQRLLAATYPWYELRDPSTGLSGGFKYERKQNSKGEEVGGIVPHITLESIAKNESPKEEVLVDKPVINNGIIRVTGPFVIEATIPTPMDIDQDGQEDSGIEIGDYYERLFLALRQSPVLRLSGNQTVEFEKVKETANSLNLRAEALIKGTADKAVAFVFGPPSSAVSEKQVFEAAREAHLKGYSHLYVLGFACQDRATKFIKEAEQIVGIPTSFVNVTMDIQMGDLLKNQRSSQIFSITGSPEIRLIRLNQKNDKNETLYRVELLGLDTFDPIKAEVDHVQGNDVPCWLLDTDYNELSFKVCQAFFPRTGAWENLKKSLKAQFDDSVWEHFRGNVSEAFAAGENEKIAVKVIDDRGNELMLVKPISEAAAEGAAE